ncbi:hypothetical protein BHM04_04820 [Macrococcus sp. IME1552]|nr:hypothetical protein [Macrococcus sp. IME1552]ATD30540.1 hypothetical protein BHM04_04820 [Macrococcus sp. IME1552]
MNEKEVKLVLGEVEVTEFQFKLLKRKINEPLISSKIEVFLKSKVDLKIKMNFIFKDMNLHINGEIIREMQFNSEIDDIEKALNKLIKDSKGGVFQPIYGKASKLIANITDESYLFPLIVPVNAWYESEDSNIEVINEIDELN